MSSEVPFEDGQRYRVRLSRSIQVGRATIRPSADDIVLTGDICRANAEAIINATIAVDDVPEPSAGSEDGYGRQFGQQAT